jgi:hypothetical protein
MEEKGKDGAELLHRVGFHGVPDQAVREKVPRTVAGTLHMLPIQRYETTWMDSSG